MWRTYARVKPQDSTRVMKSSMSFSKKTLFSQRVSSASMSRVLRRMFFAKPFPFARASVSVPAPARLGRCLRPRRDAWSSCAARLCESARGSVFSFPGGEFFENPARDALQLAEASQIVLEFGVHELSLLGTELNT